MKDERTISVLNQAASGGFSILFFGLLAVMVYRQFVLGQDIREHLDVAVVWSAAGVYAAVTAAMRGVDPVGEARRNWMPAALAGLAIMGIQIYNNAMYGVGLGVPVAWFSALLTFLVGFVFVSLVQAVLAYVYRRWESKNLE